MGHTSKEYYDVYNNTAERKYQMYFYQKLRRAKLQYIKCECGSSVLDMNIHLLTDKHKQFIMNRENENIVEDINMEDRMKRERKRKLTQEQIKQIHDLLERGLSQKEIASKFAVSQMTISKMKNNTLHSKKLKGIIVNDVRGVKVEL